MDNLFGQNGVHKVGVCERHGVDVDEFILSLVHRLTDDFQRGCSFTCSWHTRNVERRTRSFVRDSLLEIVPNDLSFLISARKLFRDRIELQLVARFVVLVVEVAFLFVELAQTLGSDDLADLTHAVFLEDVFFSVGLVISSLEDELPLCGTSTAGGEIVGGDLVLHADVFVLLDDGADLVVALLMPELSPGRDRSSTSHAVVVTDRLGHRRSRLVPERFVRRLIIFNFASSSSSAPLAGDVALRIAGLNIFLSSRRDLVGASSKLIRFFWVVFASLRVGGSFSGHCRNRFRSALRHVGNLVTAMGRVLGLRLTRHLRDNILGLRTLLFHPLLDVRQLIHLLRRL